MANQFWLVKIAIGTVSGQNTKNIKKQDQAIIIYNKILN